MASIGNQTTGSDLKIKVVEYAAEFKYADAQGSNLRVIQVGVGHIGVEDKDDFIQIEISSPVEEKGQKYNRVIQNTNQWSSWDDFNEKANKVIRTAERINITLFEHESARCEISAEIFNKITLGVIRRKSALPQVFLEISDADGKRNRVIFGEKADYSKFVESLA